MQSKEKQRNKSSKRNTLLPPQALVLHHHRLPAYSTSELGRKTKNELLIRIREKNQKRIVKDK